MTILGFCLASVFNQNSYAQFQVFSTGQVAIGSTTAPPSEMQFALNGKGQIKIPGTPSAILFENYLLSSINGKPVYNLQIVPTATSALNLGSSLKRIGALYTWDLDVVNNPQNLSDRKFKENIVSLDSALNKVLRLHSVRYDLIKAKEDDFAPEIKAKLLAEGKNKIGFIAQEVKEVIPEIVRFQEENQFYTMDYISIIPFLTKAIQEQQVLIEELQAQVSNLSVQNAAMGYMTTSNTTAVQNVNPNEERGDNSSDFAKHILYQNIPNPFNGRTEIKYYLTSGVNKAQICIYNMSGQQLKCVHIETQGGGSIWIEGQDLQQGMYLYALVVNGALVDMKKMVLTN